MNFILSILEGTLGLTEEEKNTIEPCLPSAKAMIDRINEVWPSVQNGVEVLEDNKPSVTRLLDDMAVLLPNASALLGEGAYVDIGGSISKVKDMQSVVNANPKTLDSLMRVYSDLEPVIVEISRDWPSVEPAYNVILDVAKRRGFSLGGFLSSLHQTLLTIPNPGAREDKPINDGWD